MTPMQEQYNRIKDEYKDAIVLFRMGDFYEAFNEDAITISKVLGITLTGKGKDDKRTPMAGFPHHALPNYLPKLVDASLKVAIADQMEEPQAGKLVERQVTKVITPGTVLDENSLDSSKNNYIASVFLTNIKDKALFTLVYCDLSTGELKAFETYSSNILKIELNKIKPAEIIVDDEIYEKIRDLYSQGRFERMDSKCFDYDNSYELLKKQFNTQSLKGYGIEEKVGIIRSTGALINYLVETQKTEIKHIRSIKLYNYSDYMQLDPETIRNLELVFPMNSNDLSCTVFGVLNECQSSMGKRKLRQWILNPLINPEILQERLDAVEYFYENRMDASEIREYLRVMSDIERIAGRIGVNSANPKDLIALKITLEQTLNVAQIFENGKLPARLKHLLSNIKGEAEVGQPHSQIINQLIELINTTINDDAPAVINEGGIIKTGYNSEIDEYRSLRQNSRQILAKMQQDEIIRTNISSLKISYNNVFGYYIEVTRTHLDKVPSNYVRKQTLANAERFITQELKELEDKILYAEEKLLKLEMELFIDLRNKIAEYLDTLLKIGEVLSEIDVLANFGHISRQSRYCKPKISQSSEINILNGRHLVVENLVENFTPNTTEFKKDSFIHILTGPNMSGKSTYIRQVALMTLLAQIGCFVPAESMEWQLVDRIFTRVGASDNLSRGESTFMVEMTETANILNNATEKSLVILDEVGRGTSTYDGVAIAWSIIEYLLEKIKCKTLFATHYHELIALEEKYKGIKNFNVEVLEINGEIMFKHKIISGSTNRSYGVHVAKLAGVPEDVVEKANGILKQFEGSEAGSRKPEAKGTKQSKVPKPKQIHPEQLGLI